MDFPAKPINPKPRPTNAERRRKGMSSPGEGAEINPATPFEVKPDEGSAYKFSQTLGECTVQIPIPKGTRGKMMTVELRRNRLAAGLKGQEALIKGQLYADIDTDESVWTIGML